ncbi:hypothetical protein [Oceanobacillus kapialis]|uniref:Uncharacterized protein n=1 Tax=Oceanobacillus kapialis TaxID=481353 RepID=A0ABW5Q1N0_9BACI
MKKGFIILIAVLSILIITACSHDELSGKTFDVSVVGSPNEPSNLHSIMTLEFSDGNKVKNKMGYEEGSYELQDDKLVIQFENENELLEIEFALKESDIESSQYAAEIINLKYEIEDSKLVVFCNRKVHNNAIKIT